jgi:CRISPR-associated protein Cas1
LALDVNVGVSFLSEHGRFLARVQGQVNGNVLLRRGQYGRADSETASATIAKAVLLGKIANSRTVLLRADRDRPTEILQSACVQLAQSLRLAEMAASLDSLRGIEGSFTFSGA